MSTQNSGYVKVMRIFEEATDTDAIETPRRSMIEQSIANDVEYPGKANAIRDEIGNNMGMDNPVSRDEVNAKFDAINANMQAHEARFDARIDRLADIVNQSTKDTQSAILRADELTREMVKESRATRWTVIATGIAVAALLVGGFTLSNNWLQTNAGIINGNLQTQVTDMKSSIQDLSKQITSLQPPPPGPKTPTKH